MRGQVTWTQVPEHGAAPGPDGSAAAPSNNLSKVWTGNGSYREKREEPAESGTDPLRTIQRSQQRRRAKWQLYLRLAGTHPGEHTRVHTHLRTPDGACLEDWTRSSPVGKFKPFDSIDGENASPLSDLQVKLRNMVRADNFLLQTLIYSSTAAPWWTRRVAAATGQTCKRASGCFKSGKTAQLTN